MAPSTTSSATTAGIELREGAVGSGPSEEAASALVGRGFATWEAERINLLSPASGAWGTTIFRKQVGQSICPPLVLESAVICWPHTGQANLKSLIASLPTIPHGATATTMLFLAVTLPPFQRTFAASAAHEKTYTCLPQRTICRRPGGGRGGVY